MKSNITGFASPSKVKRHKISDTVDAPAKACKFKRRFKKLSIITASRMMSMLFVFATQMCATLKRSNLFEKVFPGFLALFAMARTISPVSATMSSTKSFSDMRVL